MRSLQVSLTTSSPVAVFEEKPKHAFLKSRSRSSTPNRPITPSKATSSAYERNRPALVRKGGTSEPSPVASRARSSTPTQRTGHRPERATTPVSSAIHVPPNAILRGRPITPTQQRRTSVSRGRSTSLKHTPSPRASVIEAKAHALTPAKHPTPRPVRTSASSTPDKMPKSQSKSKVQSKVPFSSTPTLVSKVRHDQFVNIIADSNPLTFGYIEFVPFE
jgi:hypothetical protein